MTIISQFDHRGKHFLFSKSLDITHYPFRASLPANQCEQMSSYRNPAWQWVCIQIQLGESSFVKMPTFLRFTAKKGTLRESCTFNKLTSLIKPVPKELMSFNLKYVLSKVHDFQSQSRDLYVQYVHNQCKQKFYIRHTFVLIFQLVMNCSFLERRYGTPQRIWIIKGLFFILQETLQDEFF